MIKKLIKETKSKRQNRKTTNILVFITNKEGGRLCPNRLRMGVALDLVDSVATLEREMSLDLALVGVVAAQCC